MIRRPPRSTQGVSSAASDVYKRQTQSTWGIKLGLEIIIKHGNKSERDLFIFRTGLDLLEIRPPLCIEFAELYKKQYESYPLLNLLIFLSEAILKKDFALFKLLLEKYKPSIDRDPLQLDRIHTISMKYFNKPIKAVNMMESLMKNMLGLIM
eukprot:TRINITY_DN12240_c0_g1_i2.p1 TRINITY_DN12240_c0_g1~~TRINITY_DN12240_c0_g1_i2.p1  ORF type:complete len:152 (-),score=31.88 TRINITY_DN12240_c0_g1_i2:38-493(-)